jgi:predicted nicotinamide N-methyase
MSSPSPSSLRAFIRRNAPLRSVPDVPEVRLHMADDVTALCRLAGDRLGLADPDIPYWAFPWAGGLALARYVMERPECVANKRVLDLGSGSGLCAIVALRAGARSVTAVDIDPFAEAAIALNGRANRVRVGFNGWDILGDPPPACDVILAGDICYEETMASRMVEWLRLADRRGIVVLLGDPGRRYLAPDLERLASYTVRTTRELERTDVVEAGVYAFSSVASVPQRRETAST